MASRKIKNSFFDLIALTISMILSTLRSIGGIFGIKTQKMRKNIFFDTLHFIFSTWPKYFWKSPSLYKLMRFPGDIIDSIFKK